MNVSELPLPRDWAQMLHRYVGLGWSPSLLTFMFAPMCGDRSAIRRRQAAEVEEIYGRALTRMVRDPTRSSRHGRLPLWLCAPDFPVAKRVKQSLREVTINDGQHVHATCLTPPRTRLRTDFVTFVEKNQELLAPAHLRCLRVDARAVIYDLPGTFDYAMKSAMRLPDDDDGFFILPRGLSEVRNASARVGRNSSLFGSRAPKMADARDSACAKLLQIGTLIGHPLWPRTSADAEQPTIRSNRLSESS